VAVVIGASVEQVAYVKQCLADWQCISLPLNDEGTGVSSIPEGATLAIVYAQKEDKNTLAICGQFRSSPECRGAPILLAIGRYEIGQGISVKRMGNATFILMSFSAQQLRDKIKELVE